ncbi:MATE family efflux transporter [Gallaecimonas kandeliae]|uniref:MATE family efflux transporter n=1 Tax=Gallaecimonas kandeliae TaxID=3029055 RepID=UPI00264A095E|nr:MATE family efflux transporter [Gallaecimonas kandeliae]WKE66324.1 MATE family efflux transporter [Gallaecimonas kandeliae]
MRDLTQGSISGHVIKMAIPIMVGMLVQTLYLMVDLYFVSRLGSDALAGVNAAANAAMLVMALTQMLSVGTVALLSHAVGAKQTEQANLVFNQAMTIALALMLGTLVVGYAAVGHYMGTLAADQASRDAGILYLHWYLPGLALQFVIAAIAAALRGTGIVKPTMTVQLFTVLVNMVLTPIMTAGWLTGHPLGVKGAALSSTIAVVVGTLMLAWYFLRLEHLVKVQPSLMKPHWLTWRKLFNIGLPSGGEFIMLFLSAALAYWAIRGFGAEAQAALGIGGRVMQLFFLPALAMSFALPAIAGQNLGARQGQRIRESFKVTLVMELGLMLVMMLLCRWKPELLLPWFSQDAAVLDFASQYLAIASFTFLASGVIFTCSALFQGLGNTWPALLSSAAKLVVYAMGVFYLVGLGHFELAQLWYWMVAVNIAQALFSFYLVRREMGRKLGALAPVPEVEPA